MPADATRPAGGRSGLSVLLDLIARLDAVRMPYTLGVYRDAVMVTVAHPGHHYEIEVFDDGHVEVEVFVSRGGVEGEEVLAEMFRRWEE